MDSIIIAENLYKTYRKKFPYHYEIRALQNVSLTINRGEFVGILGPNGAGKTTLLSILSLQLLPDAGKLILFGKNTHSSDNRELKYKINISSGNPNFPWCLTVREILIFYGKLYGLYGKKLKSRVDECIQLFQLEELADRRYENLSTGGKQRIALAKVIINQPEVLFLDEPTVGLDPNIARQIRKQICQLHQQQKTTIVLTTHYMKEVEELCQRIYFIKNGKIIATGTPEEIKKLTQKDDMEDAFIELAKTDNNV